MTDYHIVHGTDLKVKDNSRHIKDKPDEEVVSFVKRIDRINKKSKKRLWQD